MEKLDDYLRITGRKTALFVTALTLVLASAIVWGIVGVVPIVEPFRGIVIGRDLAELGIDLSDTGTELAEDDSAILCFCDASRFRGKSMVGNSANITLANGETAKGTVVSSEEVPMSRQDADALMARSWFIDQIVEGEYVYGLIITTKSDLSGLTMTMATVEITVAETSPISFLLR